MIVCDTWEIFKEKFLVNEDKLIQLGVKKVVLCGEFQTVDGSELSKYQKLSKETHGI